MEGATHTARLWEPPDWTMAGVGEGGEFHHLLTRRNGRETPRERKPGSATSTRQAKPPTPTPSPCQNHTTCSPPALGSNSPQASVGAFPWAPPVPASAAPPGGRAGWDGGPWWGLVLEQLLGGGQGAPGTVALALPFSSFSTTTIHRGPAPLVCQVSVSRFLPHPLPHPRPSLLSLFRNRVASDIFLHPQFAQCLRGPDSRNWMGSGLGRPHQRDEGRHSGYPEEVA